MIHFISIYIKNRQFRRKEMKKGNAIALLPIGVFLAIYLGLGLTFEYILHI